MEALPPMPVVGRALLVSQGSTTSDESLDWSSGGRSMADERNDYEQLMILHQAKLCNFELVKAVAHGTQGSVFAVRCTLEDLPPNKLYALKIFYDIELNTNIQQQQQQLGGARVAAATRGESSSDCAESAGTGSAAQESELFRRAWQNEWRTLSTRLRHNNIIRIWTCFEDNITEPLWDLLPEGARSAMESSASALGGRCAQFVVFDHHDQSVADYLKAKPTPLPYQQAKKWAMQLMDVACFLFQRHFVHGDLRPEHLLLTGNLDIVVTGFSRAQHFKEHYFLPFRRGVTVVGDNWQHTAPEVHDRIRQLMKEDGGQVPPVIDYGGQTSWAIGVLIYECLMHSHPLPGYPEKYVDEQSGVITFKTEEAVSRPLPSEYSEEFNTLLLSLLDPDPRSRLDVVEAKKRLHTLPDGTVHHQLTRCQALLEEERKKTAKLTADNDDLLKTRGELVKHRVTIIKERKELSAQVEELQKRAAELTEQNEQLEAQVSAFRANPLEERLQDAYSREEEVQARWTSLNREKEEAVDGMDEMTRTVRRLTQEKEQMEVERTDLQLQLTEMKQQRSQTEAEVATINSRYMDMSHRERRSTSETKQAKEGHLLTMRELEEARKGMHCQEERVAFLQRQLVDREMEVIQLRGQAAPQITTTASPYATAPANRTSLGDGSPFSYPMETSPVSEITHDTRPVTGLIAMATPGTYTSQQSSTSSVGIVSSDHTPATPPPQAHPQDPLAVAQQNLPSAQPQQPVTPTAPGHPLGVKRIQSNPCMTPGCEFYGREETDFFCSGCSKVKPRAHSMPPERPKTEPHRYRPAEPLQRRLELDENDEVATVAEESTQQRDGEATARGGGVGMATATSGRPKCKQPSCPNAGSEEFQGYCSFPCVLEFSKQEGDREAKERAFLATMVTGSQASAVTQAGPPQRSQSMVHRHVTGDGEGYSTMPVRRVCRSLGCNQPALQEFSGFCVYCYQSKASTPFYNEGAERCLNAHCSRAGEPGYGGFCRECYVRTSNESRSSVRD